MSGYIGKDPKYGLFQKQVIVGNGSTTTFTLSFKVAATASIMVAKNGLILEPGFDYSVSNSDQLTFTVAPLISDKVFLVFLGRELSVPKGVLTDPVYKSFTGNGSTTVFSTSPDGPLITATTIVAVNGVIKTPTTDFSVSGTNITFVSAPANAAKIDVYIHGVERVDGLSPISVPDGSITTAKLADDAVTNSKIALTYSAFTAVLNTFNGMTISPAPTVIQSKYLELGEVVKYKLHAIVTLTGTPRERIRVTLPLNNDGSVLIGGRVELSNATTQENGIIRWASTNQIDIERENSQPFTLEAWTIKLRCEYERVFP